MKLEPLPDNIEMEPTLEQFLAENICHVPALGERGYIVGYWYRGHFLELEHGPMPLDDRSSIDYLDFRPETPPPF